MRLRSTPREPPADAAALVRSAITAAPYRFTATATVAAPAEVVRARLPRCCRHRVTPVDDATRTVSLGADDPARFLGDLVALGAHTLDGMTGSTAIADLASTA
ncbi:hypothetical protein [Pseudonocardia abyssalis]|uniref:hypothetical protein n=1 Tax=Pseudonocardia abyssalis TaxID=2792008 RepID=UPI003FD7D332